MNIHGNGFGFKSGQIFGFELDLDFKKLAKTGFGVDLDLRKCFELL